MRNIPGLQSIRVERTGDPRYTANWFIYYDEYYNEVPLPTFSVVGLSGGKAGTSP